MLLKEQNQTTASNVTGNSTREFIIMSLGLVAVVPRNNLPPKISRRRSFSSRLWMQLLRQMGWFAMQPHTPAPHLRVPGLVPQHAPLYSQLAHIHDSISTHVTNLAA